MSVSRAVAIVGIGCRFPGGVVDAASFWKLLLDGRDAVGEVPSDRFDAERFFDPRPSTPGRMISRRGGFLDHVDEFDPAFFGISPREAERMDPQQRLLLETAWEALEDAGVDVNRLEGSRTGVYVGQWTSDFESRLFADAEAVDFQMTTGSGRYAASGRVSYALGLRGPSMTIDSACSSSLAAVHLAVAAIRSGECSLALAGGVNMILQPHISVAYSQSRMIAGDGHCKFADASGDGYVRSEGAALVLLKPLAQALADGDRVIAVVRGSAVNNDGRSSGVLGRPSRVGHEEMLRAAYADADVPPARVGYIEAHGTGTRAGDPVELTALGEVIGSGREAHSTFLVGSVKTNIGHTESAAGIAGLIKAALALKHGRIPASLHFVDPNPAVPWAELPLRVPTVISDWPPVDGPRVAGVNGFGISGSNAHVVLEEAPRPVAPPQPGALPVRPALLVLSARGDEPLRAVARQYADLLDRADPPALRDVCWQAATRRTPLEHRAVFVAETAVEMLAALRRFVAGEAAAAQGVVYPDSAAKAVFVFPGQGAQSAGMARALMASEPVFDDTLRQCDAAARPFLDVSIRAQLLAEPGSPDWQLDRIDVIQPVLVALAIAYARLWESLGVVPDAVVGHSMGEVGAAHVAGALDLDQAMQIICRRSALMRRTSGRGAMALVELSHDAARDRIAGREAQLAVAVSNSPRSSVISGDPHAVAEVMDELARDEVFCRLVKVDVASHSPQMEPLAAELAADLAALASHEAALPIHSTVLARRVQGEEFDAGYWARNLREPVRFADTVASLLGEGANVFVELGPHPVLLPSVQESAQAMGHTVATIASGEREEGESRRLMAAIGGLWAAGLAIDWRRVLPPGEAWVDLPRYPWQRERHWIGAAQAPPFGRERGRRALPAVSDEARAWLHQLVWHNLSPPRGGTDAPGRWLVVAPAVSAARLLASAFEAAGARAEVADLSALEAALAQAAVEVGEPLRGVVVVLPDGAEAAFAPIAVLQSCLHAGLGAPSRLWWLTRGGQVIEPGAAVDIDQAAAWGTARVLAEEHPDLWGGLVDLDPAGIDAGDASTLAQHLLAPEGEEQVALRRGRLHAARLVALDAEAPAEGFTFREDAAYLVTGGLGGVGMHIARTMAARGARRLILLGRSGLPPRGGWSRTDPASPAGERIAAVRALEASGVAVHVAQVDLTDDAALRSWLEGYAAEAWPPIRGVVHAAAALDNHLAAEMDRSAFDAVVRPKLRAAQCLDQLLPDVDLFVLFSSIVGTLGQSGEANYAAANAGLDALAHRRRGHGRHAVSIAWGIWAGTGFAGGANGERVTAELARQGIRAFPVEQGTALFDLLCATAPPAVAVLPIDWALFRRARLGRGQSIYRELIDAGTPGGEGAPALCERLAAAGRPERRQLLEGLVRESLGTVLKVAPARIDPRKAFGSMGLTSLLAMELRNRLEAALGHSLSATLAWNYPTLAALADHLAGVGEPPTPARRETAPPGAPIEAIADLSDAEVALALRRQRTRRPT